jgi:hypothetical protein
LSFAFFYPSSSYLLHYFSSFPLVFSHLLFSLPCYLLISLFLCLFFWSIQLCP